jgi:putative SOS response-associated peptidase YedK
VAPTLLRPAPDSGRQFRVLPWGLIPSWAEDPRIGNRLINARAETVATKPPFHHAFRERRCLILADGFYEWRREGHRKQPFYIRLRDGRPFVFAGLWEGWTGPSHRVTLTLCRTSPWNFRCPSRRWKQGLQRWAAGRWLVDRAIVILLHIRPPHTP